jgi:hypothetical protein
VVITRFVFTVSAVIVARLVMSAAMVVACFALARSGGVVVVTTAVVPALVIAPFAFTVSAVIVPRVMPTTVVLAVATFALAPAAPVIASAVEAAVSPSVSADRVSAASLRHCATRDALTDGPTMTASMASARPPARRTPAMGVARAAREQREPGCDNGHSRAYY